MTAAKVSSLGCEFPATRFHVNQLPPAFAVRDALTTAYTRCWGRLRFKSGYGEHVRTLMTLGLVVLALCNCGISTKLCGAPGQPCCAAAACDGEAICNSQDVCESCGAASQRCCANAACGDTLTCTSGLCAAPLSCAVMCTLGAARCANNGIETCTPQGSCPAWTSTIAACPTGTLCTETGARADCAETCPGACVPDTVLCTNEGLKQCVSTGACPSLSSLADDTSVPRCITGAAVNAELSWESPSPFGQDVVDIAGELPSKYWLLDSLGNTIHYEDGSWIYEVRPSPQKTLRHLASCGQGSRLFAVGDNGTVLRRIGAEWSETTIGTTHLTGIVCDFERAYASGADGTLYIRNNNVWAAYPTGFTEGWADLTLLYFYQQVLLVGRGGRVVRCDVSMLPPTCTPESTGTTADLRAIWSSSSAEIVWAVGAGGTILNRASSSWSALPVPAITDTLVAISGVTDASSGLTALAAVSAGGQLVTWATGVTPQVVRLPEPSVSQLWTPDVDTMVVTGQRGGLWYRNGIYSREPFQARGGRSPVNESLYAVTSIGMAACSQ